HEAWAALGRARQGQTFPDRRHLPGLRGADHCATSSLDLAAARQAERRGGDQPDLTLNTAVVEGAPQSDDHILRVHEALEELATIDARLAQVVEMRYFGGLLEQEIAEALGVTERTIQRDWQKARILLSMSLKD
ncbi:hypothetical protein FUT87_15315, partial [Mitsuaria sp. TWR114]|uniref:ECF-type sigma factor n=1 Tax=Mitsuaria sp. TWR114 TaxID=2601731 RepID=UPI0011BF3D97